MPDDTGFDAEDYRRRALLYAKLPPGQTDAINDPLGVGPYVRPLLDLIGRGYKAKFEQSPKDQFIAALPGGPGLGLISKLSRAGQIADVFANVFEPSPAEGGKFDPLLKHGISGVKLPRPVSEMTATYKAGTPIAEKTITPADLQGGLLYPAIGDRTIAGQTLTGIQGNKLPYPVPLQGGHGYMPANAARGSIWASDAPVIAKIENQAGDIAERTGKPVYLPYTAMGPQSADYSHHIFDPLAQRVGQSDPTKGGQKFFDRLMRARIGPAAKPEFAALPDWPGVMSPTLRSYLAETPAARAKFAKYLDTRAMQNEGFPSVAEVRYAVTDPRLLHEPTGASGLSISQFTPGVTRPASEHGTYGTGMAGVYKGGFGMSVPKETMYPDIINSLRRQGYEPYRFDYLMGRPPAGTPLVQRANQQWVDRMSNFLERAREGQ